MLLVVSCCFQTTVGGSSSVCVSVSVCVKLMLLEACVSSPCGNVISSC